MKSHLGFTIVELLVTMSISAALIAIATPQFSAMRRSFDRLNAKTNFVKDLKRAQAESITQGCRGIMVIAANAESYSFGCDYLSYDTDPAPSHDVVSFVRNLPSNMNISSTAPIIFNSRGQAIDTDYIISNLSITFEDVASGAPETFATGTLLGTGVFSFD